MNISILQGNLATDVRFRTTATDKQVASFKLAVNRNGRDAGADFIWVKVWNGSAVACNTYLKKGSRVLVDGSIRTSRTGEGSEIKEYFEVNARQVTFLDPNGNSTGSTGSPPPTDDETPEAVVSPAVQAPATPAAVVTPEPVEDASPPVEDSVEDDDIPF